MSIKWITLTDLLLIHERVIEETGGVKGILNPGELESALRRPFSTIEGDEVFPDLLSKISVLIHSIIAFHPFADGNKRTAFVSADVCLRLNGYKIMPSKDADKFFKDIARGEKDIDDIKKWLKRHIIKYSK